MTIHSPLSVAIIGGGFCGSMTFIQLARQAEKKIHISLFYHREPHVSGLAFSSYSDLHLLNVPAKNMSAFQDVQDDFLQWCKANHIKGSESDEAGNLFFPRNIYGKYLKERWQACLDCLPKHISYEIIRKEVREIKAVGESYRIRTGDDIIYAADKIVLATGNHLPRAPFREDHPILHSPYYAPNPWKEESVSNLDNDKSVLIAGTGLTMADVVQGLTEKKFSGKIIAVSPKGFEMLPHRKHEAYTAIHEELKEPYELGNLFRIFRKHVRKLKSEGKSAVPVVDAMRAKTQEIWQHLSLEERNRFMMHVRHLWGVARHRLPADIHETLQGMMREGRLEIIAGRIVDATIDGGIARIRIKDPKGREEKIHSVQRLINCTGPESDPAKFSSALFRQLLSDGIILVDDMKLGIKADSKGKVESKAGLQGHIYAMGSLLRGTLWETTAVPELRKQAEDIARQILD